MLKKPTKKIKKQVPKRVSLTQLLMKQEQPELYESLSKELRKRVKRPLPRGNSSSQK